MNNIKILNRIAEIERDRYQSSGDYSVTGLIDPPRVTALRKRHEKEVIPPLSSVIPSIMGTAMHEYSEKCLRLWAKKHNYEGYTFEEEVSAKILNRKVSGRYDIRDIDIIDDIKTCKTWKLIFEPDMIDWIQQQNCYAFLLYWDKKIRVRKLLITAFYKDWIEGSALRDKNYPQEQVIEYELPLWPLDKTGAFIVERLQMHIDCENLKDNELPPCTREERWERFPGGNQIEYAIMKSKASKRAAKLVKTTLDDAIEISKGMKGITKDSYIEVRYAQRKRCEKYCSINSFCNDYISYMNNKKNNTLNDYIPLAT